MNGAFVTRPFRTLLAACAAGAFALALAPRAHAYVYWANWDGGTGTTIGRATVDGGQVDQGFIKGAHGPCGLAVGGGYIYWGNQATDTIGRARLDGTDVRQDFITGITGFNRPCSVAVDSGHIYWDETVNDIGRANLDGTGIKRDFIPTLNSLCGVAVDSRYVYWANDNSGVNSIGRANLDGTGVTQSFIPNAVQGSGLHEPCNPLATPSRFYYTAGENTRILAANLDGSNVSQDFITGVSDAALAADSKFLFWSNQSTAGVGRANLDGSAVNHSLIPGSVNEAGVAVDSNFFTFGELKRKPNGTATLALNVPGPGQASLQGKGLAAIAVTGSARRSLATAGGSVKLKIRPGKGRSGRALRHKLATKGKARVRIRVTYVPTGGDANTQAEKVKLVKK